MTGRLDVVSTAGFLRALRRGLPRTVRVVVEALAERPGALVSTPELIDRLYGDREDGGPDCADDVVGVAIMRARRAGVPIVNHHSRGFALRR